MPRGGWGSVFTPRGSWVRVFTPRGGWGSVFTPRGSWVSVFPPRDHKNVNYEYKVIIPPVSPVNLWMNTQRIICVARKMYIYILYILVYTVYLYCLYILNFLHAELISCMLCDSGIGHVVHLVVIMIQQLKISSYELTRKKYDLCLCNAKNYHCSTVCWY